MKGDEFLPSPHEHASLYMLVISVPNPYLTQCNYRKLMEMNLHIGLSFLLNIPVKFSKDVSNNIWYIKGGLKMEFAESLGPILWDKICDKLAPVLC